MSIYGTRLPIHQPQHKTVVINFTIHSDGAITFTPKSSDTFKIEETEIIYLGDNFGLLLISGEVSDWRSNGSQERYQIMTITIDEKRYTLILGAERNDEFFYAYKFYRISPGNKITASFDDASLSEEVEGTLALKFLV